MTELTVLLLRAQDKRQGISHCVVVARATSDIGRIMEIRMAAERFTPKVFKVGGVGGA